MPICRERIRGLSQRSAGQIVSRWDRGLSLRHQDTPAVPQVQRQPHELLRVGGSEQQRKVKQTPFQPVGEILGITAHHMDADSGVLPADALGQPGDHPHGIGFAGADHHIAGDSLPRLPYLLFRLGGQIQDLLGPLPEQPAPPGSGQCAAPVFPAPAGYSPAPPPAPGAAGTGWAG